ncbi:hypothetical protein Tco_1434380, partial [Tanacetum coccineum]
DNVLIVQDGLGYDWSYIAQDEPTEFSLIAYTSNSLGSDTKANLEIVAYQLGLESVKAQLVVHQKNEAVYEEKIAVLEFKVKDKDLNKLINSQLSTKDKTGLGYGDQLNESDSEVINSVFDSRSSDGDDNQTNDRFKKGNEYHAVPPPLTRNYIPPLANLSFAGLDDSIYRPTTNKTSASLVELSLKIGNEPVKSDKQAVQPRMVTQSPTVDRKDWNGKLTQKLVLNTMVLKKKVNTVRVNGVNTAGQTLVSTVEGNGVTAVKASAGTKQTVVANSTTEAEYIAVSHCCGQVLWIQNQMLDYGFNFMQTRIHVDNESAICVVKNPVYHSKIKHIEIRHHFIRDSYEKRLIEMVKIHTDYNVADLLTKAFDVTRFQFLIASIDKKELAIPGQTTTGKEFSNLLMADNLPKTILPTKVFGMTCG